WEVSTGRHAGTLQGHTDRVPMLAWHPRGRFLVSAGWDTTARVWDTTTCAPVILLNSHAMQVSALAFSPDGNLLACADSDDAVHVWDFDAKKTRYVFKVAGSRDLRCLAFSPDGKRLAGGGGDRVLHLWDPERGQALTRASDPNLSAVRLSLSPDGKRL